MRQTLIFVRHCFDTAATNNLRLHRVTLSPFGFQPKGLVYFAVPSLRGKLGGIHACGATFQHTLPLTKYFSNSFVFKNEIEKEGLPGDITPALGAGDPRFKSAPTNRKNAFLESQGYYFFVDLREC